jgi:hypothetical protein
MLAVATALFTAWCDQRPGGALSRSFYLRAVSSMKNQLSPRKVCEGNDILAAVLLLQLYEEAVHQPCRKQQVHREVMIKMLLMK